MAHDSRAARHGHELALEADQAARRNAVVEPHASLAVGLHVEELAAPAAERFHHRALARVLDIYGEHLVRLAAHAVDFLVHHPRPRYCELVALAPHVLDQDREVQLAAPRDDEGVGVLRVFDAQRDVALGFALEALADLAAGH